MRCYTTDIPTVEPDSFYQGDTVKWNRTDLLGVFNSSLCTLTYYFAGAGTKSVEATANADGTFSLVIAASDTKNWSPGQYGWQAKVKVNASGEVYPAGSGRMEIIIGFANITDGVTDIRSYNEITLDKIKAWLSGDTSIGIASYVVDGREMRYWPPMEIEKLKDKYFYLVKKERAAEKNDRGQRGGDLILERFTRP